MDASEATSHKFAQGTPVYALGGEKLGLVGKDGVLGMYLIMRAGRFFRRDASVPVSAIERADARGVYLNRTRAEIRDLTLGGWSNLGSIDLNTRKPADSEAESADTPPAPSGPNDLATTSLPHVPDSR